MSNIFRDYKCPICNGTLRTTKRLLNCGQNEWHELNRIVCNHCKVKSGEMECSLEKYKEKYWNSFNEAVKRKKERETRKPEKILTDILNYLNGLLAEWNGAGIHLERICLVEKQLVNLAEYAEKLGVEL